MSSIATLFQAKNIYQKFYAERYYQKALSSYELSYTDEEIEHKNFVAELLFLLYFAAPD